MHQGIQLNNYDIVWSWATTSDHQC